MSPYAHETDSRLQELLDYATVYGDWDESTPDGEIHTLSALPMNEARREAILEIKAEIMPRERARKGMREFTAMIQVSAKDAQL